MKNTFKQIVILLLMVSFQLYSQEYRDTIKSQNKKRDGKETIKNTIRDFKISSDKINMQHDILSVPLNLNIYQKVLTEEMLNERILKNEELATGLTSKELTAFEENKKNFERMLTDIYGEDLIDVKKILEKLGITKDQVVLFAALLKFLFYHPFIL